MIITICDEVEYFTELNYPGIVKGRYSISTYGKVHDSKKKKILKPYRSNGYLRAYIKTTSGKKKQVFVHRLVAYTYCPNYSESKVVNHKDSMRDNNFYKNLEWVTCKENSVDGFLHGYNNKGIPPLIQGECQHSAKSNDNEIHEICKLLVLGYGVREIMEYFGHMCQKDNPRLYRLICKVKARRLWKHVSKDYKF